MDVMKDGAPVQRITSRSKPLQNKFIYLINIEYKHTLMWSSADLHTTTQTHKRHCHTWESQNKCNQHGGSQEIFFQLLLSSAAAFWVLLQRFFFYPKWTKLNLFSFYVASVRITSSSVADLEGFSNLQSKFPYYSAKEVEDHQSYVTISIHLCVGLSVCLSISNITQKWANRFG